MVGYFDTATMLGQLGLQAHITPPTSTASLQFGISVRVETGRDTIPGAFTVTWIDVDPEHQMPLVDATTDIVMEQLGNERLPRHLLRHRRPPQLHLHRLDRPRSRAGGAPGRGAQRAR